ncbi:GH1 family beta-glucosidase [Cohnella soli]|uniref:Beta-glucosidase n=1 Tax=Cohnella soli TaxID=425005 RepID=A0ABW0I4T1_9BACL
MIHFSFPSRFMWGAATSAFQIEGGVTEGGREASIWDVAARDYPDRFWNGDTPETAADFYHRYPEDIASMKELGLRSFRLSLSWSRILPEGTGEVNEAGLDYYDKVIDCLLQNGIEPFVDLYHWDLPQALAERGGFKNPDIVDIFRRYAEICFRRYGDRVKLWSTMNEPSVMAFTSYLNGIYPPYERDMKGALLAGHHMLLMHYEAVKLYRSLRLDGEIGAVVAFVPVYPDTLSAEDRDAANRQFDFVCGWWLQPLLEGSYPESLLQAAEIGPHLPDGSAEQLRERFEPMDMIGLNYYTPARCRYEAEAFLSSTSVENFYAQSDYGFQVYPQGLFDSLRYMKDRYGNPKMYLTENGFAHDSVDKPPELQIDDDDRIAYMREHLRELHRAIGSGCNVHGYYYWSYTDTYEATSGYRYRFGLVQIDYETQRRTRKKSWHYYRDVIAGHTVD